MRVRKVNRYYCDFCKKAGGSAYHIRLHEAACTANPNRECGMCEIGGCDPKPLEELITLLPDGHKYLRRIEAAVTLETQGIHDEADEAVAAALSTLREAADGCPACMLAALRQSGCARFSEFSWQDERDKFLTEANNNEARECHHG